VLVRNVTDSSLSMELQSHYVRLCEDQEAMLREVNCLYSKQEIAKSVSTFYLRLFRYLQLLQKEACLKVTISEIDLSAALETARDDPETCILTFQSNLRKEAHVNKTSNEKSSESSIRNDKELTK
jgi:predicted DNA-binding protein (UPF0251 family)